MEPVSPELVLVDPALAERARWRHTPPEDTLARVEILIQTSRMASLARRSMEPSARRVPVAETRRRASRRNHRRSAVFVGGTAACALLLSLLLGVHVDLRGNPAGADTVAIDEPSIASVTDTSTAAEGLTVQPPPERKPPQPRAASQRFVWAPQPGASGYHVELFRGARKVFGVDATSPAVTVPARWTFERQRQTLEPGEYRWYVWPIVSGRRAAQAIVQAKLVIPPP